MKKLAFLFVFALSITVLSAANLLKNGGFEGINPWHFDGNKHLGSTTDTVVWGGASSLMLRSDAKGNGGQVSAYQGIKLTPGRAFKVRMFVKCEDVKANGFSVRILVHQRDANGKSRTAGWIPKAPNTGIFRLYTTGGTHDWKKVEFVIPGESVHPHAWLLFFLQLENTKQGTVYVDDVEVEEEPLELTGK